MNDTKRKVLCLLAQLFAIPGFVLLLFNPYVGFFLLILGSIFACTVIILNEVYYMKRDIFNKIIESEVITNKEIEKLINR